jgi:rhodanese-related sulfurtransferase
MIAATLGTITVAGCDLGGPAPKKVTVLELAGLLEGQHPPRVFDANGNSTREEYGVIPGATLLSSSSSYALDLLPTDKATSLVFYCASSWCGAADGAAKRAMRAGYNAVSVLPDGIKGWTQAGLPTTNLQN